MKATTPVHSNKKLRDTVTIAVFPFENLSAGKDSALFCASLCMDLITELSKFRQFQIISMQSMQQLNPDRDSLDKLNADYHVLGSFRFDRQRIRVNAQLVESHSLRMVWANRFDASRAQMLEVQEDLLQEILGTLQEQLNYDLLSQLRKKESTKLSAYEYWLYGMEEIKKGTVKSDEKAREFFREAISIDPEYSLAYSGMSLSYFNDWSCQLWERWEVSQNGAFEWAEKAIELDEYNYIAASVLGRVFLYKEAYETAEHYIRKSLHLNNNDPSTLIQNATSLVYIGYPEEALELYEKSRRINPANEYLHIGSFIRFMCGHFKEAQELISKAPHSPWIDQHVYTAGAHYFLGNTEKMMHYWNEYLVLYKKKITRKARGSDKGAIEWFLTVNPFRKPGPIHSFLEHLGGETFSINPSPPESGLTEEEGKFTREGELWTMGFAGTEVTLPEVKGFHDLQKMLSRPNEPFHCAELMETAINEEGISVLDAKAKRTYQAKILSLQENLAEAENNNDFHEAAILQKEYDELVDHLANSLGLGGRSRKKGNSIDKARSAVTWRIRSAISKIEKDHPRLGIHLSNSIRTGTTCSYHPEKRISWQI